MERLRQRYQDRGADYRPPVHADAAEQGDDERLRGGGDPEHGLRRNDEQDDSVEPARGRRHRCAQHDREHLPAQGIDARCLRSRLILLDGEQRHAEARALDMQRHDHADDHHDECDRHVHTLIGELGVECGRFPHHRQRHLLIAQPLEHVEHGQGVGQHRQREVVAAQPKGRHADDDAGEHAHEHAERNADPRRNAKLHECDRHRIAAEPEERGMAERDHAAVAAQHVPAEPHGRPQQHQGHDQLVVGIADEKAQKQIDRGEGSDGEIVLAQRGAPVGYHVRSHTRPNIPCGRKKMISRKTTKMAVFCS